MAKRAETSSGKNSSGGFILKGGHMIDPAAGIDAPRDVYVEDGKIQAVDVPGSFSGKEGVPVNDISGCVLAPGFVDVHVHFREPGFEWKETVHTGAKAAVAGGYTRVCCMPNTKPPNDRASVTESILEQARSAHLARVLPIGAITEKQEGKALSPMLELREAGCVAFSDDGFPVFDAGIMRRALEYSLICDAVLCCHEEEKSLCHGFSMNESALSLKMGLKGMPGAAEDVMVARDIELARLTRARVHFCHVSTARSVTLIKRAKEDGIAVTAEVAPHHFTLTEQAVEGYNTNAKMSPPLRSEEDRETVLQGLSDGVLDCIACDHAPHEADSKRREFDTASFGIIGLQTNLPLTLAQVEKGKLSLRRAIEALTSGPAKCLGLEPATLRPGSLADIVIFSRNKQWTFTPEVNCSKSANSPFLGWELKGSVVSTIVGGVEVYRSKE